MRLYHKGSCDVTAISRYSGVTNAATSQLVDRLVEKQLVERTENAQDRRMKQLSLTPYRVANWWNPVSENVTAGWMN